MCILFQSVHVLPFYFILCYRIILNPFFLLLLLHCRQLYHLAHTCTLMCMFKNCMLRYIQNISVFFLLRFEAQDTLVYTLLYSFNLTVLHKLQVLFIFVLCIKKQLCGKTCLYVLSICNSSCKQTHRFRSRFKISCISVHGKKGFCLYYKQCKYIKIFKYKANSATIATVSSFCYLLCYYI